MFDIREYAEAAAALIRLHAEEQRNASDTYIVLGETAATNRARGVAAHMDYAAKLLREKLDPPYDAKAAAASHLAGAVYKYLDDLDAKGIAGVEGMSAALEAYDAVEDGDE